VREDVGRVIPRMRGCRKKLHKQAEARNYR
jgi:hypothetical protein